MIIGIDLGTTNSLVAIWRDGQAHLIPNALGEYLTPSVVGVDENGDILTGQAAKERLLVYPEKTVANFKRYMGSHRTFELGALRLRPEELSALLLKSLKADAEVYLAHSVKEAVITVPAYFNDVQRKATKAAAELAGLKVDRLLNEPTAAALAYGLHDAQKEKQFLVFDLGGGTFDVSVLELFEGIMEVRASAGDAYLGGEDFVERLMAAFRQQTGMESTGISAQLQEKLRFQAEKTKRLLTDRQSAAMELPWQGETLSWQLSQQEFESLADPLLQKLRIPVERALRDATIRAGELDEIVLVGGATRMPMVRKLVARMFGRLPAGHIHPDEVVALGAAVQAGLIADDKALKEVVLTDVCPFTLGIEIAQRIGSQPVSGHYLPIIERNTVLPASRVEQVTTVTDYQKAVNLRVYQGESRMVKDNIFLGELKVPLAPLPAGKEVIHVRFTYDINGLLEVVADAVNSDEQIQIIIEENPGVLSKEEIKSRFAALAHLKIHPREQTENRALLARAERMYEEYIGDLRHYIGRGIAEFQAILARQDSREIEKARRQFEQALDEVEQRL